MSRIGGIKFGATLAAASAVAAIVITLQVRSGSWEAADAIGGALAIHAAYLVPAATVLIAFTRETASEDGESRGGGRLGARGWKVIRYAAVVAVVLGAAVAIVVASRGHDESDCQPDAKVDLFARPAGQRSVEVSARVREEPACGHPLWFVLQIHDVNGHSEFYPRQRIKARGETDLSVTLPPEANLEQRRSASVYEVNETIDEKLRKYSQDGGAIPVEDLVRPPCAGCAVSVEITLPYSD